MSDLHELLRQCGLAMSGTKAQLVERLQFDAVDPSRLGNRPIPPSTNKSGGRTTTAGATPAEDKQRWSSEVL